MIFTIDSLSFFELADGSKNIEFAKKGIDKWVIKVRCDEDDPIANDFINEIRKLKPAKGNEKNVKILDITEVPVSINEFKNLMCRLSKNSWFITQTYDVKEHRIDMDTFSDGNHLGSLTA